MYYSGFLILSLFVSLGSSNLYDELVADELPENMDLDELEPGANLKFTANVELLNQSPISEKGMDLTCSHELVETDSGKLEILLFQIGVINELGARHLQMWTYSNTQYRRDENAAIGSSAKYDIAAQTLSVKINQIVSPIIGQYVCLVKTLKGTIVAVKAMTIIPVAGVKAISLFEQEQDSSEMKEVESFLHKDYNGAAFDLYVKVDTQDKTAIPVLSLMLDGQHVETDSTSFVYISKVDVKGKIKRYDTLSYRHTLKIDWDFIRNMLSQGYQLKISAKTHEELPSQSVDVALNITGAPAKVTCNSEETYFKDYNNNEIACIVVVNPRLSVARFIVGDVQLEPEIRNLQEYTYEYKLRFNGDMLSEQSEINFSIDGPDGMMDHKIFVVGKMKPTTTTRKTTTTKKVIVVRKKVENAADYKTVTLTLMIPLLLSSTFSLF